MTYVVIALVALSAGLLVAAGVTGYADAQGRSVNRQLAAIRGEMAGRQVRQQRNRQIRRHRLQTVLEAIGGDVDLDDKQASASRAVLQRAGFRHPKAVVYYYALRILCAAGLGFGTLLAGGLITTDVALTVLLTAVGGIVGWLLPSLYLRLRVRHRQEDLRKSLPDALDLLVVCVEAGLGLNQAMSRVSEEIERLCPAMSDELTLVSLEIRAGAPRADALRSLASRTGVSDIRSLAGMLIQTDRFGTSVARGLRVHSDSLRTKRRQRAEEAAAKTSVKMLFPLVFLIFPAVLVVILGPAVFHLGRMFGAQ